MVKRLFLTFLSGLFSLTVGLVLMSLHWWCPVFTNRFFLIDASSDDEDVDRYSYSPGPLKIDTVKYIYRRAVVSIKIRQPSCLYEPVHIHVPTRSLRSESHMMLNVPLCKLKTAQSAFCFSAPIVWNRLSEHIRTSATRDIFSGRLKMEYGRWFTPKAVSLNDSIVIFIILFVSINFVTLNKLDIIINVWIPYA